MEEEKVLKLKSVYKDYIWGGTKIRDILRKDTGDMERIAESWEVSTHADGQSAIAEGEFAGKSLCEYFDLIGWNKLGEYGNKYHNLPILVKYIDAKENLSIQVHPDDEYSRANENDSGKNEMWTVLDAEDNAFIYLGFNKDTNREEVERHIKNNTLEKLLNKIYVKKGETYYIPAGTVHAIGKGCLICEIQQTSNITYRLYDYGRKDKSGNSRELHLKKALEILNYQAFNISEFMSADLEIMDKYLKSMLTDYGCCSIVNYEATDGALYDKEPSKIKFAIVYYGKGKIFCENEQKEISCGDAFLLNGQAVKITGKCNVILINL